MSKGTGMRLMGLVGLMGLGWQGMVGGAVVAGAKPKDWPADPESHVVDIQREAETEKEEQLIAAAEAAVASPEALRAVAGEGAELEEGQWWLGEALDVRLPFALTGEAVAYYEGLVEGFRELALTRYSKPSSRFEYLASVRATELFELDGATFTDVYVVKLSMQFSQNFVTTTTEGMHFEKERVVILDQDGKVVHISGDGPTEAAVLAI